MEVVLITSIAAAFKERKTRDRSSSNALAGLRLIMGQTCCPLYDVRQLGIPLGSEVWMEKSFLQWDTMLSSILLLYSIFGFYRRLFIDLDVFHVFVSIQVSRRKVLIENRGRD
jgi:hypothetical protein